MSDPLDDALDAAEEVASATSEVQEVVTDTASEIFDWFF